MPDDLIHTDAIPAEAYDRHVADAFEGYENPLGLVQILCIARGSWPERVGPFLSWALALFVEGTGSPLFSTLVLIAPPGSDVEQLKTKLCESVAAHRHRLGGPAPDEDILNWLGRIVPSKFLPPAIPRRFLQRFLPRLPGVLSESSIPCLLHRGWTRIGPARSMRLPKRLRKLWNSGSSILSLIPPCPARAERGRRCLSLEGTAPC